MTDPNYTMIRDDVLSDLGWTDDDPKVASLSLSDLQKLLSGDPTGYIRELVLNSSSAVPLDANAVILIVANALLGTGNISVLYDDVAKAITVATTATVNASDAYLLDRFNHTGTQGMDTIDSLELTLGQKYVKPGTGIPKTDLSASVQTTLTKADADTPVVVIASTDSAPPVGTPAGAVVVKLRA